MTRMKLLRCLAVAAVLLYMASFSAIHCIPGLRCASLDGDWYYCDVEWVDLAEFYGFWPLRQLGYSITGTTSRHISERLPLVYSCELICGVSGGVIRGVTGGMSEFGGGVKGAVAWCESLDEV